MQDRYDFPAVLHYNQDERIGVYFPDLPGCVSQGKSDAQAIRKATEALELHLFGMEEEREPIPEPSSLSKIATDSDEKTVMITAIMALVREECEAKSVKKTLTIPYWLNRAAEAKGFNFSALLQHAIKEQLGVEETRGEEPRP